MIRVLTSINVAVSFFVWLPSWLKILRTRSARDYSMWSLLIILWLQVSNLAIAIVCRAPGLRLYLAVNTAMVALTCALVWRFRK